MPRGEPREGPSEGSAPARPPELFILSDLHLSAGEDGTTRRVSRLETFFYDQEFANLVDRIIVQGSCARRPVVLILNGDVFDFLAVTGVPDPEEQVRLGIHVSRDEQKYGMDSEPAKDAWKMRQIVRGHPRFFLALLRLLSAGHRVHITRGNHDIELFWPEVRQALFDEMAALAASEEVRLADGALRELLGVHDWYYYEPGRIWVEHGHQYEDSNSLRYLLNPVLASRNRGRRRAPSLDLPTGSMFVRYVYNRFKVIDPYSTQVFNLEQYLDVISTYNVIDLARALVVHFPFFMRTLKKARIFEVSGMAEVSTLHAKRLEDACAATGLGEKLATIDGWRKFPLGVTKYTVFRKMLKPIVRNILTVLLIVIVAIGGWMLLFSVIQNTPWLAGSVLGKASLMAVLAVLTIVGLFLAGTWVSRRARRLRDSVHDILADHAQRAADLLDVPLVAMGHSHGVEWRRLDGAGRVYGNSGTWTMVRGPWDTVRPFGRQFTFLHVHDDEMDALRWNDAAGRWEPVTFLEEHDPSPLERIIGDQASGGLRRGRETAP